MLQKISSKLTTSQMIIVSFLVLTFLSCAKKAPLKTTDTGHRPVTEDEDSQDSPSGAGNEAESSPSPIPNVPPVAVISQPAAVLGSAPFEVLFSGQGSYDSDGSIASYAWNFGNGESGSGASVSHTFEVGTYEVTLQVTDNQGLVSEVSATLTITVGPPNLAPIAASDFILGSGATSLTVEFNGSPSTDLDGTIVDYLWDFGDGVTEHGVQVSHTYPAGGTYVASLRVIDNLGAEDIFITDAFTISPPPTPSTCTITLSQPSGYLDVHHFNPLRPANSSEITATITIAGDTAVSAMIDGTAVTLSEGRGTKVFKPSTSGNLVANGSVTSDVDGVTMTNSCSIEYYVCRTLSAVVQGTYRGTTSYLGRNYSVLRYTSTIDQLNVAYPRFYQVNSLGKGINDSHGRAFIKFGSTNLNHISSYNSAADSDPYSGRDAIVHVNTFTGAWGKAECGPNGSPSCANNVASGTYATPPRALPGSSGFTVEQWTLNGTLSASRSVIYYCR